MYCKDCKHWKRNDERCMDRVCGVCKNSDVSGVLITVAHDYDWACNQDFGCILFKEKTAP